MAEKALWSPEVENEDGWLASLLLTRPVSFLKSLYTLAQINVLHFNIEGFL